MTFLLFLCNNLNLNKWSISKQVKSQIYYDLIFFYNYDLFIKTHEIFRIRTLSPFQWFVYLF